MTPEQWEEMNRAAAEIMETSRAAVYRAWSGARADFLADYRERTGDWKLYQDPWVPIVNTGLNIESLLSTIQLGDGEWRIVDEVVWARFPDGFLREPKVRYRF